MSHVCPSCGRGCISPKITSKPIWIVKDQATQNEIDFDTVFSLTGVSPYGNNENTTSYYLQKEMGLVNLNFAQFSKTCLHMHTLPKARKLKADREIIEKCVEFGKQEFLKNIESAKLILCMGSEVTQFLTGYNVSEVYGLTLKATLFTNAVIVPAPNPDKLMAQPMGELRNALKVFSEQVKILNQYMNI